MSVGASLDSMRDSQLNYVNRRSDVTLINGLGRWFGNPTSELAVINVTQGKR